MFLVSSKGGPPSPFHHEFCCDDFNQGATPVWSPDGKYLLFRGQQVDDAGSTDWWVAPVDGGEPARTGAVENLALSTPVQWPTAWSGDHVYFVSGTTVEGINIFRVPIDPGNWRIQGPAEPLTTGPGMKFFVSATPDGRIFFTDMTIFLDVWSVSARPDDAAILSNPKKLTTGRLQKFRPSITRDGTKVAFSAFGGVQTARFELKLRDLTSGEETTIPTQTMSFGSRPRLSPDGSLLCYRDFVSNKWRTFVFPVGGASGREICDACLIFDFFPDTDFALVQVDPDKLEKMDLGNKERSSVLEIETGSIRDAKLSPDGAWISYLTDEPDGRAGIWIAPIKGIPASGKKRILIIEDDRYLSTPEWSPNGRYLYFLAETNDRWTIYAQKLDPLTKEPVEEAIEVYFSPDSKFHLNFPLGNGTIGVAVDKIIFKVTETTGNIYLARPKSR